MVTVNEQRKAARDTAANWTSNNPTLLAGEKGWESDTALYKVGDGSTAWVSLDYSGGVIATGTATPNGSVTPAFEGQLFVDTTADVAYIAVGITSADWDEILTDSSGATLATEQMAADFQLLVFNASDAAKLSNDPFVLTVPFSDQTTIIATGTAKVTFNFPIGVTITDVIATLKTADNALLTLDINDDGTTILSTKLTVDSGEKTSDTAATAVVISAGVIAAGSEMTIDVDGAGTAAVGGEVHFIGYRT